MGSYKERRAREKKAAADRRRQAREAARWKWKWSRLEVPGGIVFGVIGSVPGLTLAWRFAFYAAAFMLFVVYAIDVPPHTRNMAARGKRLVTLAMCIVALGPAYLLARLVDTAEGPQGPRFTAEISEMKPYTTIINGVRPRYDDTLRLRLCVLIENTGAQQSSLKPDWTLSLRSRSGEELHTDMTQYEQKVITKKGVSLQGPVTIQGPEAQVWHHAYKYPIQAGGTYAGYLTFVVPGVKDVGVPDYSTAQLHFEDTSGQSWTSSYFDVATIHQSKHLPCEPFPAGTEVK